MKWSASVSQIDPPRPVAILLATVAGFVDACIFLGLFGLFVAQLTGSYVFVGTSLVMSGWPGATVMLAVPVFFAAGVVATLVATTAGANGLPALACGLLLETVLIAGFAVLMVFGAPFPTPARRRHSQPRCSASPPWACRARWCACCCAVWPPPTSTNTTQIAVDATRAALTAALTWGLRRGGDPETARQHAAACRRLAAGVALPLAFFAGTMIGAFGYEAAGPWVLALPVAVTGALTLWVVRAG